LSIYRYWLSHSNDLSSFEVKFHCPTELGSWSSLQGEPREARFYYQDILQPWVMEATVSITRVWFRRQFWIFRSFKIRSFFIFNIYILKLLKKHWKNMEFNFFASETHPWGYQWNSSPFSFLWIDKTHNSSINEQSFDLH